MTDAVHQEPVGLPFLPLELFFMVRSLLDPPSQLSLALTCKPLFNTLYLSGQTPRLNNDEAIELLLRLEKDNPALVVCFQHGRLRPFDPSVLRCTQKYATCAYLGPVYPVWYTANAGWWSTHSLMGLGGWKEPPDESSWMPELAWPDVTFSELHLIMNRHRYGEEYGLPLGHLAYNYEFERFIDLDEPPDNNISHLRLGRPKKEYPQVIPPRYHYELEPPWRFYKDQSHLGCKFINAPSEPGPYYQSPELELGTHAWRFKHTSEARVIRDELYLRRHHSITGPPVPVTSFYNVLQRVDLPMCRHLRPGLFDRHCHGEDTWPKGTPICRSCWSCYMDYVLVIKVAPLSAGWSLSLTTYHRFGPCRTPSERFWWSAISTRAVWESGERGRMERFELDRPVMGEIHDQWEQILGAVTHKRWWICRNADIYGGEWRWVH